MAINTSPDKGSFSLKGYKEELLKNPDDETAIQMIEFYKTHHQLRLDLESTEEWKIDNLEYDLRTNSKIIEKCANNVYAQHVYAALCNNEFQRNDVYPILTDKRWSCSWRHAGGIVADIQQTGDYIDWYCSGMRGEILSDQEFDELSDEQKNEYIELDQYVSEGTITDEIRRDFFELGWIVLGENT